ncbi:hypothetical protein BH10PSE19_BH10PSE19_12750 [soil metagenome]
MIIELNYLIALFAFGAGLLLYGKGKDYMNAAKFMWFFAAAALLGGIVHHIELRSNELTTIMAVINTKLPCFLTPLQFDLTKERLWYVTVEAIGFAEFYFMFLFIEPVLDENLHFVKRYLQCILGIYIFITTIISTQYFFVVVFHLFSHSIIICFALYMYFRYKIKSYLLLVALIVYNLMLGVMQQLMSYKILATGSLHYNDWYHIGLIFFIVFLFAALTRGKLVEDLQRVRHVKAN